MNKRLLGTAKDYLDLIRALVVVMDAGGRVEFVNEWLCFVLGYKKKEMIGKNWFENFIPKEIKNKRLREFKKFLSGDQSAMKRENYAQHKNGDLLLIDWQDNLLKDKEGRVLGLISSGEDITEKFVLRHHLKEQRQQNRKELMQAVLEAAEIERKEIAYELHDGINQVLTVCKLLIEQEMICKKTDGLKKVSEQLQKVIDEIRLISHRLNPSDLGNEGLYGAVTELIREVNGAGRLSIKLKLQGARHLKKLPAAFAMNLFRILQETLNNILKHAEASIVHVELFGSGQSVDLEIRDDGRGFSRKQKTKGLGLKTIYTRAEAIGGKAYIASAEGEGTILSVHVPIGEGKLPGQDSANFEP